MQLTDADRIRNLLATYCQRIDAGDFAGVGTLFADGCLADEHGSVLARGADEVTRFYERTSRRHADGSTRTKHLVVNSHFDPSTADGSCTVRSSYVVLQATDAVVLQPIIAGGYVDRFEPGGDEGWHFAERRFRVDLLGDLSDHLAVDVS